MAKQTDEQKRRDELIDELLKDYKGPESFWGQSGLFAQLKKRIIDRTLNAEMDSHLGYTKHDPKGKNSGNSRNGRGKKTVVVDSDQIELEPPGIATARLNPSCSASERSIFRDLMIRFWPCMVAA